jgi:hypothetical protein
MLVFHNEKFVLSPLSKHQMCAPPVFTTPQKFVDDIFSSPPYLETCSFCMPRPVLKQVLCKEFCEKFLYQLLSLLCYTTPPEAEDFSSDLCVQTGSEVHPVSCKMGTGGSFPGAKERPGRDADHSPPSSAGVKKE